MLEIAADFDRAAESAVGHDSHIVAAIREVDLAQVEHRHFDRIGVAAILRLRGDLPLSAAAYAPPRIESDVENEDRGNVDRLEHGGLDGEAAVAFLQGGNSAGYGYEHRFTPLVRNWFARWRGHAAGLCGGVRLQWRGAAGRVKCRCGRRPAAFRACAARPYCRRRRCQTARRILFLRARSFRVRSCEVARPAAPSLFRRRAAAGADCPRRSRRATEIPIPRPPGSASCRAENTG